MHKHIGSQITKMSPFVDALKRMLFLIDELNAQGLQSRYLDIGGGLGISYTDEEPPVPEDMAKRLMPLLEGRRLTLIMEPGRSIVGNAGILVTKTLYLKKGEGKEFVIVDAGMNDLIRPSLYDAYHHILPVTRTKEGHGPLRCGRPDMRVRRFPRTGERIGKVKQGEYLAVMSAGAYGLSMSSNYNSRPRAAEVMVKDGEHFLIRQRETYDDLVRNERIPAFLK